MDTIQTTRNEITSGKSKPLITAATVLDGLPVRNTQPTLMALKTLVESLPLPCSRKYSAADFVEAFYTIDTHYHSNIIKG